MAVVGNVFIYNLFDIVITRVDVVQHYGARRSDQCHVCLHQFAFYGAVTLPLDESQRIVQLYDEHALVADLYGVDIRYIAPFQGKTAV